MSKRISVLCAGALALFSATSAFACEGSNILYEDDFATADPAWGTNAPDLRIENGTLLLQPPEGGASVLQNQSGYFEGNLDICVDVIQNVADPTSAWAALLFGGIDYDNYYLFQVATNGFINVARYQKGRWIFPVAWKEVPGVINSGATANQIRVVTRGNQVSGYVNGQEVVQFRAQLPADGGLVGLYATTIKGAGTFDFDNFQVTEALDDDAPGAQPPATPPAAAEPAPAPAPDEPAPPAAPGKPVPGAPGIPKTP